MWTTILIVLGIIVFIGIIRILINRPNNFGDMMLELFCLDLVGDFLAFALEHIDFD